ncbi:MAG: hypothetical protein ACOYEG_14510 [Petrimonas sp.]|jgi:ABC-type nitrate/sulfonate/bicarbonate transport system substrate-binding protein
MEKNNFLAKKTIRVLLAALLVVGLGLTIFYFAQQSKEKETPPLVLAISPYQDLAMIVNIDTLDLQKKYNTKVKLVSMAWEEILTSVASSGKTVDVGFGSLVEYITQEANLNQGNDDDVIFLYPAYIFKGGGFVSLDKKSPVLTKQTVNDPVQAKEFLSKRIGAQKNSIYEMMIYSLANRHDISLKSIKLYDIPLNDGIYALENKSLDLTSAGLTQKNEIINLGGEINLTMDELGFADITGFICKKSTYSQKKDQIDNLLRMWFDCVAFVMADLDQNSKKSMEYLRKNASTKYTIEQYKTALSQEYFPLSIAETNQEIISDTGKFSYKSISEDIANYLLTTGIAKEKPQTPTFIELMH